MVLISQPSMGTVEDRVGRPNALEMLAAIFKKKEPAKEVGLQLQLPAHDIGYQDIPPDHDEVMVFDISTGEEI